MSLAPSAQSTPAGAARVRVMVVDDSVVIRGLIARWLDESGEFEAVATASNGRIAVEALGRVEPDLVVLDIEMPEMDGITALPLLMRRRPNLKVVVVSTLTLRNAEISLKCLSLGAIDYVAKPDGHRQVTTSITFRQELIEKLKAIAGSRPRAARPALRLAPVPKALPPGRAEAAMRCDRRIDRRPSGDRGSAGRDGSVLQASPCPGGPAHAADVHGRVRRSSARSTGRTGLRTGPGRIPCARYGLYRPGGRHMGLSSGSGDPVIRLDDSPPVNFCRPAVDVLFRDAAARVQRARRSR